MTERSKAELTTLATTVRDEGAEGANTATRIGGLFQDVIDSLTAASDAAPAAVAAASAAGSSDDAARSDHVHAHGNQAGGTLHAVAIAGGAAGFMSGADKTKLDGVALGATALVLSDTTPANLGTAAAGDDPEAARGDHVHGHGDQAGGTLHAVAIAGGAAGFMSGADKTKLDGVSTGAAALTSAAPANVLVQTAAAGAATAAARADHVHNVTVGTPVAVGTANANGSATSLARSDHVHAHGNQAGGTLHADAIAGGASGFMSGADKTKLDGIGTANLPLGNNSVTGVKCVLYHAENDNGDSGSGLTVNWTVGGAQKLRLTGNATLVFTAPGGVTSLVLKVQQDATGGRTITWPASVKWAGGTAPTLSTGANLIDIISFYYDGTNYYGALSVKGAAA